MDSRTNKMALVWSREHNVYKTKWSHSCQLKWLSVNHYTLVQEENHLSQSKHIWQGDTAAHRVRADMSEKDTHLKHLHLWSDQPCLQSGTAHRQAPGQMPHLASGVPRHLSERLRRVQDATFKVYVSQDPDHCWDSHTPHTKVLLHTTLISFGISRRRLCPAGLRSSPALLPTWLWRSFLARPWPLPCPPCCLPDLQTENLGLRFIIRTDCCVCVLYIS